MSTIRPSTFIEPSRSTIRLACLWGVTATAIAIVGAMTLVGTRALAQSGEVVRMIVPYGKGGGSDQLSRALASSIEEVSSIKVDVNNIKKGAGLGAIPEFMKLPADGNTIIEHIDDVTAAFSVGATEIHPGEDWEPLAVVQLTFSQLFINADETRFRDWPSFLKYARANPGKVVVANVSYDGSMENITMRKLEREKNFKTRQVSFDSVKDRYESVFHGRADVLFEQPGDVRSYLDDKRLKPILTFYTERPKAFANVPTHMDIGAKFKPLLRFRGFFVRSGTPKKRLRYLRKLVLRAYQTESFQNFNKSKYMTLIDPFRDPQQSTVLMNESIKSYTAAYQDFLQSAVDEFFNK